MKTFKRTAFAAVAALLAASIAALGANYSIDGDLVLGGTITSTASSANVNKIAITSAATAVVPQIAVGGASADANIGIAVNGNGTGSVYLGGTTAANAPVSVAHGTTNVNQVIMTGTNTGSAPSITVGGSGADANVALAIKGNGTGIVNLGQTVCTVAASANAGTCSGQKGVYTTASLSTAAGAASTAQTITNTSVTTTSVVLCTVNAYSGALGTNGNPTVTCIPGSGTISATVVNGAPTNALSGTVGIGFFVAN